MNISDCGSEHSLAMTLGGRYGLPHGLTVGLVLAESMDVDRRGAPDLFERIADALGEPADGTHDGSRAVRGVERILFEIDFPVLSAFDVDESDVDELAAAALSDYFITLAPWDWTADDAAGVYRRAFEPGRAVDLTSQAGWLIVAPRYKSCFQMFEPGRIDDHEVEAE